MKFAHTRAQPRKLSQELALLQARTAAEAVTLRKVIVVLRGRAYLLLVMLLALPFITPVPMLGLSTPFGLAIALIALRLTLGQRPWLPKRFQRKQLPAGFFARLFKVAASIVRFFERFLRPRWVVLTNTPLLVQLHAACMFVAALALLLPLPIPFTNSFPAWAILFIAAGLLERDGLAVVLGYLVFAAGVLYFFFLGETTAQLLRSAWQWLGG